jgi:hypothetical protein
MRHFKHIFDYKNNKIRITLLFNSFLYKSCDKESNGIHITRFPRRSTVSSRVKPLNQSPLFVWKTTVREAWAPKIRTLWLKKGWLIKPGPFFQFQRKFDNYSWKLLHITWLTWAHRCMQGNVCSTQATSSSFSCVVIVQVENTRVPPSFNKPTAWTTKYIKRLFC